MDPEAGEPIAEAVFSPYAAAELILLEKMAEHLAVGMAKKNWSQRQQVERLRFRNEAVQMQRGLQSSVLPRMGRAVKEAAALGHRAADTDLDSHGVRPMKNEDRRIATSPQVERRAQQAIGEVSVITAQIADKADSMYVQIKMRVDAATATSAAPENLRRQAVQQALNVLTARGITGFRDNAGRNWSLSTYLEMKSRTIVNQQLIDSHTERMRERGFNLLVVSSHARPAPQCQPFEGQVLSLDGTTGTVTRPNAAGPGTVSVRIKATLEAARAKGFQHQNCRHAVSAFIPGASRTFTTEPDAKGYEATQRLRAMERAIRETKRKRAIAVEPAAKRRLSDTLRRQQAAAQKHRNMYGLNKRPQRERVDLGYDIGDVNPRGVMPPTTPKPTPDAPSTTRSAPQQLSADTVTLIEQARSTLPAGRSAWRDTTRDYPRDTNGAKLVPAALTRHLDTTLRVGAAIKRDTDRALTTDTTIARLRAEDAKLVAASRNLDPRRRDISKEIATRERDVIQAALADVRSFGGVQQTVTAQATRTTVGGNDVGAGTNSVLAQVRRAETVFPDDWLNAANRRGELSVGTTDRAFYARGRGDDGRDLIAAGDTSNGNMRHYAAGYRGAFDSLADEIMAHELGHRMEQIIPGLTQLEYAFVRTRSTRGGVLEPLTPIYGDSSSEVGYADDWANKYAGKSYATDRDTDPATVPAEVFQVGLQDTFGRSYDGGEYDRTGQLQEFVMGVLALL